MKASAVVRLEILRNHNEFLLADQARLLAEKAQLQAAIKVETDRKEQAVLAKLRAEQEAAAAAEAKRRAEEEAAEQERQAVIHKEKFAAPLSELERKLAQARVCSKTQLLFLFL